MIRAFAVVLAAWTSDTLLVTRLPLALALSLLCAPVQAGNLIKEIVVSENSKTTDGQIKLIADVDTGEAWSDDRVADVKAKLLATGLFKSVEVFWDASPKGGGVRVHILAKDKHSWIIAPTVYWQPTQKGVGVVYGENNLGGENKKILVYGQLTTGDSFAVVGFQDPSINGGPLHWQLDAMAKTSRILEYAPPSKYLSDTLPVRQSRQLYFNVGLSAGFKLDDVKFTARLRGAKVTFDRAQLLGEHGPDDAGVAAGEAIPTPNADGRDVSVQGTLSYDDRATWQGVSRGTKVAVSYERGLPEMGSDFAYWIVESQLVRARTFWRTHNYVWKVAGAYGRNLPFWQELTLGGASMRGWKNEQFRGNVRVQANLEYTFPLLSISSVGLRGIAFWDSGYTTFTRLRETDAQRDYLPGADVRGLTGIKNSVGGGARLVLKQVVLPLLGVDVGYGLERRAWEVYVAVGLTD